MYGLNPIELVVIGVVAVLLFQWRLPTLTRDMRRAFELDAARRNQQTGFSRLDKVVIAAVVIIACLMVASLLLNR